MSKRILNTLTLVILSPLLLACQTNSTTTASSVLDSTPSTGVNQQQTSQLIGSWRVKTIRNEAILSTATVRFTFSDEQKLSGFASCNNFSTSYHLEGIQLSLKPAAVTRKMCQPKLMTQENKVLNALAQIASYQIKQKTLTLLDKQNTPLFVATRIKPKK